MSDYRDTAEAFRTMAHRIVWCSAATVDGRGRPRSRILHPYWVWEDDRLVGWIATGPTPMKRAHLETHPYISLSYWSPDHDTCVAECATTWAFDDATRVRVWNLFKDGEPPVAYDPAIVSAWRDGPTAPAFAALRVEPWRLRVMPGSAMLTGQGDIKVWQAER